MAKRRKAKVGFSTKLKGAGVIAVVLGFVGVVGWGLVQKKQKEAYRSKLAEGEAKALTFKKEIHAAKLQSLDDLELANRTNTIFFPKDSLVGADLFGLTRQQNIDCDSCLAFQEEYEPTLAEANKLKHMANEDRDKAKRGKGLWRVIAIGTTGLAIGLLIL